jgi:cell wall-associated NlpC family hydrolase
MVLRKRKPIGLFVAAAIPVGIAAAFAFQTTASAAPVASTHLVSVTSKHPTNKANFVVPPGKKHHKHASSSRMRAYKWALSQKGHPYEWGGTGPGYDCSGLVMMAYRHAGIHLPRTTYDMLNSPLLVRVKVPKEGDLAFYGTGHVELFRKWGYTYGAHDSGTVVSLVHYNSFWKPTAYYRIRVRAKH